MPAGTRVVERSLGRIENRANRLRITLRQMLGPLAGGIAIITAVRAMAKFEESIATARAVTKATGEEFERLRDRALDLGVTTRFTATQAADALVLLARAGFSVTESLDAVGDTLLLAQAGGLQMAEAADITANALRGFGIAAAETQRVTDVLVATTNAANTNVSQLGQALKFVAPVARGLNQTIEQTSAAIGVLSDAGLKATLAGTGLRRVLAELASPGRELNDLLTQTGLTFDDINPKTNELVDILKTLQSAGIDTAAAFEIFGQRGGPAFEVLIQNIPKLKDLNEELNNSAGEAERVAKVLDDTLFGALKRAGSAIQGLNLAIGQAGASDILITALNTIAAGFRFVAQNADLLQIALIALAAGGVAKLTTSLLVGLLPAMRKAALTMVLFRGNVVAAAGSFLGLIKSVKVGPFLAVGAVVGTVTAIFQFQAKILKDIEQSFKNLEDDSAFSKIGTQIRQATQELRALEKAVKIQEGRGFGASDSQLAQIEKQETIIKRLKGEVRGAADAQKELNERNARGAEITENVIKSLERRNNLLAALTRGQQNLLAFQEKLNKLEEEGALPSSVEKERIRNLIEENSKLAAQKKIFEEIKGPQREFRENQAALTALFGKGAITAGEFAVKMQELRDAQAPTEVEVQQTALDKLIEENNALTNRIFLGEEVAAVIALTNQLRADEVTITIDVLSQIAEEINRKKELTETQKRLNDEKKKATQDVEREQRAIEAIGRRIDVEGQLEEAIRRVNAAKEQGLITDQQGAQAIADLQLRGLEASNSLEDGFTRAFAKISREAENLAAVGEKVVNVFADSATEAIVKFAETGKFEFKEFANDILKQLLRILVRLLVVQAISAAFGGGLGTLAGGASALAGGGGNREHGGTVQPNTSFTVGENGPELFVPDRTGTIVANQASAPAPAPVNVQVVNVTSEDDVPNAINDGVADEAIINAIARNRDRVNQVTR